MIDSAGGKPPPRRRSAGGEPLGILIALLAGSVYLSGHGSSSGPNQIAFMHAAAAAALVALRNGHPWAAIEREHSD